MRIPFVFLGLVLAGSPLGSLALQSGRSVTPEHQRSRSARSPSDLLDINTASFDQLKALPGFGQTYARRVIEARPYLSKSQLVTRGIIPPAAYQLVAPMIVAHRPRH